MDFVETEGFPARFEALFERLQNGTETCCEKRDEQFCRVLRRIAEGEFGKTCMLRSLPLLLALSIAKIEIPPLAHFVRSVGMTAGLYVGSASGTPAWRPLWRGRPGCACRRRACTTTDERWVTSWIIEALFLVG